MTGPDDEPTKVTVYLNAATMAGLTTAAATDGASYTVTINHAIQFYATLLQAPPGSVVTGTDERDGSSMHFLKLDPAMILDPDRVTVEVVNHLGLRAWLRHRWNRLCGLRLRCASRIWQNRAS